MRSRFTERMPASRAAATASSVCARGWMRLIACCTASSKSCTPRLTRLKPSPASAARSPGATWRGSSSIEKSRASPLSRRKVVRSARRRRSSSASERKFGVPPPRCSCTTLRSGSNSAPCSVTSRSSRSR